MSDTNPASDASVGEGPDPDKKVETVEALVRAQLSTALGGPRGMFEAAAPALLFTAIWLPTKELVAALVAAAVMAAVLLVIRLVQRSTLQFVGNAVFAVGIGWLFVWLAGRAGGTEDEQALAFFLPGLIYSTVYSVLVGFSCVIRWPLVGFMLGSVTGDPTAWHDNKQVVRLCTNLTWVLITPGIIGVALQGPVWLAGYSGSIQATTAVAILAVLRFGLGWPIRFGAFAWGAWLLGRNHTPLETVTAAPGA